MWQDLDIKVIDVPHESVGFYKHLFCSLSGLERPAYSSSTEEGNIQW